MYCKNNFLPCSPDQSVTTCDAYQSWFVKGGSNCCVADEAAKSEEELQKPEEDGQSSAEDLMKLAALQAQENAKKDEGSIGKANSSTAADNRTAAQSGATDVSHAGVMYPISAIVLMLACFI